MLSLRPLARAGIAAGWLLLLAACQGPAADALAPRPKDNSTAKVWIARRITQLEASGLNAHDASRKAQEEWAHRNLDGTGLDTYTLYDSAAKRKAEQQKLETDLTKLQKDR